MEVPGMGDVRGAGLGGLEGRWCRWPCDQVHPGGDEPVDDGSGVGRLAGGVLRVKLHSAAGGGDQLGELVLEALGGLIQRGVLHLLADAHGVVPAVAAPSPEVSVVVSLDVSLPQAARDRAMAPERRMARSFFLFMGELTFFPRNAEWWNIRKNLPYYSITLKVSGQEEFLWEDKEGMMVGGKTTPEPGRGSGGWEHGRVF